MPLNLNDATEQRQEGVIPDGTFAKFIMQIGPGGASIPGMDVADEKLFTQSRSSDVIMLACEFVVLEGPHARRKVFQSLTVSGGKLDEKGQSKGWLITKSFIRAMIESATGTDPKDESSAAQAKRMLPCFSALRGIEFVGKIGIEAGGADDHGGEYPDKNRITHIVTPDEPEWGALMKGEEVAAKPSGVRRASGAGRSSTSAVPAWGSASAAPAPQQTFPAWGAAQPAAAPVAPTTAPASAPAGGLPSWLNK